jgi:mono/diheme cytochrome c family protein
MMFGRSFVGALALVLLGGPTAWAADGAAVYKDQCAKCHGAEGKSDTPVAEKMKIPPLAGDTKVAAMAEADVIAQVKGAKKHPPKVKEISDDDLKAVAAHVKRLAGAE